MSHYDHSNHLLALQILGTVKQIEQTVKEARAEIARQRALDKKLIISDSKRRDAENAQSKKPNSL